MDRRQRKTRTAIFEAFICLLSENRYSQITVGQIIDRADVGRATFYAHFETKDDLLKSLCEELFDHVLGKKSSGTSIFDCEAPGSVFLHLLQHLQKNDNHILDLLASRNEDLFMRYFKESLKRMAKDQLSQFADRKPAALPEDFWVDHIASTFVETVRWWLEHDRNLPPEQMVEYFYMAV